LQIDNTLYDAFGQRQVSVIYSAINQYHVVMEIDPRYTQYPNSLRDVYVATSGQTPPGTATTNAPGGTVTAATTTGTTATPITSAATATGTVATPVTPATSIISSTSGSSGSSATSGVAAAATLSNSSARNAFTNALANTGHGSTSAGAAVSTSLETMIPLAAVSHYRPGHTPLSVNHQGLFVASTISFNLHPGKSLGEASAEINAAIARINMPTSIRGTLAGTAQLFQQSLGKEPILILTAIAAVYILLGMLYESYIHPITILSTLPSAGVGAILALIVFHTEFDIIGLIGVILLIGIVKKNAIMMVDFAIEAKRARNLSSYDAIFEACLLRFRPIMMTTSAAILGAIPLALSFGNGGEIRRPLGIAIVGGLLISQLLTLYTTPVLYLYMDRLSGWSMRARQGLLGRLPGSFGARPAG
jgi:multidrug efflux pump